MNDIFSRIKKFIDFLEISNNEFGRTIGCSSAQITQMLTHKKNFGIDKLLNIISNYPNLNPNWLLIGEGSMLRDNDPNPTLIPDSNAQTSISQQENMIPYILYEKLQEKLCEQATTIGRLQNELDNLKKQQQESPTTNSSSHAETAQKKRSSLRISGSSAQADVPTIK
ncbi:hypothetical protein [Phocaeicola dorei]|jgi:hypothetical protein|uniref:hypothetical protein n=1 Tax=Phocaeicola dorei TaxID=357276 RepID=UPI0032F09C1D